MTYPGAITGEKGQSSVLQTLLLLILFVVVLAIVVDDWIVHLPITLRSVIG